MRTRVNLLVIARPPAVGMSAVVAPPVATELEVARALIKRMKAADSSLKKADELLVCAAVACRAGEFNGVPTECARKMGKDISRPSQVTNWFARLEKLEQTSEVDCSSGLRVQRGWIEEHAPGISNLSVAPMVVSPGERHAKRTISAVSATPGGRTRDTSATVEYTLPAADGESESAAKRRDERHWHCEASTVRSLDLSGAAVRRTPRARRSGSASLAPVNAALQAALSAGCQEGLACALEHIDYSSFCRVIVECG